MPSNTVALVVVAAGRGERLGAERPKQYLLCAGKPLLAHTLDALTAAWPFSVAIVAIRKEDRTLYEEALAHLSPDAAAHLGPPAIGGATRQESVLAGLEALVEAKPDIVLIHDAARPFPTRELVARAVRAAEDHGAAAPGTPLSDTVKQVDGQGRVLATPPRASLRAVQTPQAFRFALILEAHRRAAAEGAGDMTDDVAVAEWAGAPAYVFEGDPGNGKVTTMQDFSAAEARIAGATSETRVGQGFDVHAFAPGDHVWLCGVKVPHGFAAHRLMELEVGALTGAGHGERSPERLVHRFRPHHWYWSRFLH